MNPYKLREIYKYLTRAKKADPSLPDVFSASKAPIPAKTKDVEEIEAINRFMRNNPRVEKAGGGMLVQPSDDGSRPGYKGKMKWTAKEVQEIYKDLPENVTVSKRTLPSGKTDYTYRAKIRYKGKLYTFPSKVATPENKKQLIKDVEVKWDELAPNRISREEYAKLRLLPENRKLKGEEFAEKLNKIYKKVTYRGEKWNNQNVFNYDLETPRGKKRIADDLGFFEKRTVAEAKDIIKQFSGGKDFLKNKNLTDVDITTRASEYVAQEKFLSKEGGKSWPRGRQNKRKIWSNIYESHKQGGRFELINGKDLADEDGTINWKKGSTYDNKKNPFEPSNANWRNAKFKDKKSGKIFTYDNLIEMVDKHGGGYNKAIKAYEANAAMNRETFNGKTLNDIIRESMIKKEYEVLTGQKVKMNDPDFLKYMGKRKPTYSFTEAHHFKGIKDYPFDTEPAFRSANRKQGILQNTYNKAVKSGDPKRIAKAKEIYINEMNTLSNDYGGIKYKMDDKKFVGKSGTSETILKRGLEETNLSNKKKANILSAFCNRQKLQSGTGSLACSMEEIQTNMKKQINEAAKVSKDGKIPKKFGKLRAVGGAFFGDVAIPLEYMFMAPDLVAGDIDGALRSSTAGLFGAGKVDLEKLPPGEGKKYIRHTNAITNFLNNYQSKLIAEDQLKNLNPGDEEQFVASDRLARAEKNMADIVKDYQGFGYTYQPGEKGLLEGKVAAQKLIRDKVTSDFDKKIDKGASTEFFKNSNKDLLKENLKSLGGDPFTVTPINNLEDYIKNKGEATAGNTNIFFNRLPYTLEQAEAYGVPDIFNTYAGGYAGVETPGSMEKNQKSYEIDMGIKNVRDAYSSLPINMSSQLAALEKKEYEEGMLKRRLEDQLFAGGGIAKLAGVSSGVAPVRGPNPQGLPGLLKRGIKI